MLYKEYVYFQVEPSEMTIVNRITEGLDHLGVLTALDGKKGRYGCRGSSFVVGFTRFRTLAYV